jgi:hypothetical protein
LRRLLAISRFPDVRSGVILPLLIWLELTITVLLLPWVTTVRLLPIAVELPQPPIAPTPE